MTTMIGNALLSEIHFFAFERLFNYLCYGKRRDLLLSPCKTRSTIHSITLASGAISITQTNPYWRRQGLISTRQTKQKNKRKASGTLKRCRGIAECSTHRVMPEHKQELCYPEISLPTRLALLILVQSRK